MTPSNSSSSIENGNDSLPTAADGVPLASASESNARETNNAREDRIVSDDEVDQSSDDEVEVGDGTTGGPSGDISQDTSLLVEPRPSFTIPDQKKKNEKKKEDNGRSNRLGSLSAASATNHRSDKQAQQQKKQVTPTLHFLPKQKGKLKEGDVMDAAGREIAQPEIFHPCPLVIIPCELLEPFPEAQPGAVAVAGDGLTDDIVGDLEIDSHSSLFTVSGGDDDDRGGDTTGGVSADHRRSSTNNTPVLSNAGLVEAMPVDDEESNHQVRGEAQHVDLNRLEREQIKRRIQYRMFAGGLFVLIILAVALAVGLGIGFSKNKQDFLQPTPMPTTAGLTKVPSSAPAGALDLLLAELPNHTLESLRSGVTPQYQAYEWLSGHTNVTNLPEWRKKQLFALATFFFAFEGPHWREAIRENWMAYDKEECFWHSAEFGYFLPYDAVDASYYKYTTSPGIAGIDPCNEHGEFQKLFLESLLLSGLQPSIPPEIALLTSLSILTLGYNNINATFFELIPSNFYKQLPNLTALHLGENHLNGVLPTELGLLSNVESVFLFGNALSGSIPSECGLLTSVETLYLYDNSFSGLLPSELGLTSTMRWLAMAGGSLSGAIPSELGLLSNLEGLSLSSNRFSGNIPSEFGLLSKSTGLHVAGNALVGRIPSELGLLSGMTSLWLHSNFLTGPMPSEFGLMTGADVLTVEDNMLSGIIPSQLGMLSNLTQVSIGINSFQGNIPSELWLCTALTYIALRDNSLSGTISSTLGLLSDLLIFSFGRNSFSGHIPSEIGLLSNLTDVVLGSNFFLSGPIPSELGLCTALQRLDLSATLLTGSIPLEIGALAANHSLAELNASSCVGVAGSVPESLCTLGEVGCFYQNDWVGNTTCSLDFDCTGTLCGCGCCYANGTINSGWALPSNQERQEK